MAYGIQIFDTSGRIEYDSTETTNGGVFYGQLVIPGTGTVNQSKDIIFNNSAINTEISSSPFPDFKNKKVYLIITQLGAHEIETGFFVADLYNFWPKITYRRPSNITTRGASTILVFIE